MSCSLGASRPYVWVDDLHVTTVQDPSSSGYTIRRGDVLAVRVLGQESLSGKARVREDGRISLLFLNDVEAAGLTPNALSEQLQLRLKDYLAHPVVSVAVDEVRGLEVPFSARWPTRGRTRWPPLPASCRPSPRRGGSPTTPTRTGCTCCGARRARPASGSATKRSPRGRAVAQPLP